MKKLLFILLFCLSCSGEMLDTIVDSGLDNIVNTTGEDQCEVCEICDIKECLECEEPEMCPDIEDTAIPEFVIYPCIGDDNCTPSLPLEDNLIVEHGNNCMIIEAGEDIEDPASSIKIYRLSDGSIEDVAINGNFIEADNEYQFDPVGGWIYGGSYVVTGYIEDLAGNRSYIGSYRLSYQ